MIPQLAELEGYAEHEAKLIAAMSTAQPGGEIEEILRWLAKAWQAGAKRRAPVGKTGDLRNKVLKAVRWENGIVFVEVGSNMPYAIFVEFGTKHIAGGRVKKLGLRVDITDRDAIHSWPAKDGQAIASTSDRFDANVNRRRTAGGQFARVQEQMPWLRPAFNELRPKLYAKIQRILEQAAA